MSLDNFYHSNSGWSLTPHDLGPWDASFSVSAQHGDLVNFGAKYKDFDEAGKEVGLPDGIRHMWFFSRVSSTRRYHGFVS